MDDGNYLQRHGHIGKSSSPSPAHVQKTTESIREPGGEVVTGTFKITVKADRLGQRAKRLQFVPNAHNAPPPAAAASVVALTRQCQGQMEGVKGGYEWLESFQNGAKFCEQVFPEKPSKHHPLHHHSDMRVQEGFSWHHGLRVLRTMHAEQANLI
eukprot:910335-Rhodomonas_salina.2